MNARIRAELAKEAAKAGLHVRTLDASETSAFRQALAKRYPAQRGIEWPTHENVIGLCEDYAWRVLADWPNAERPVLLFFPVSEEREVYALGSMRDAIQLVGECITIDEFGVTDDSYDWLFFFNHHDCLIACGAAAADWLEAQKKNRHT
jgi:hypothetical protein